MFFVFCFFQIASLSLVRRFGFPNIEALNNGQHGTDCRGEEHEVVVVWSITSGKKLVFCDGQEVYSTSSRSSTFEHSWSMKGNHVLKISAHANAPMNPAPGYHQYDLFVDGQSYFIMPKVRTILQHTLEILHFCMISQFHFITFHSLGL